MRTHPVSARGLAAAALVAASLASPVAPVAAGIVPDRFAAGRDANGEPCQVQRNWRDDRLDNPFDAAWAVTCRGVTAARAQGWLLAVRGKAAIPAEDCGAPSLVSLPPLGTVTARACFDRRLGLPVVRLDIRRGGTRYAAAAQSTALGPLQSALATVAGVSHPPAAGAAGAASFDPSSLAPPTTGAPAPVATAATEVDPGTLLQTGIQLNNRGQYVETSRLLNDALSRLGADTPAAIHAELEMEAGLADSNISQFDAADDHLGRANRLLADHPGLDQAAFLQSKLGVYRGQDAINRRQFAAALSLLGTGVAATDPLNDPATLSQLNQAARGTGARAAVTGQDSRQMSRLLLEAQRGWARSTAALALGDDAGAVRALDDATGAIDQLQRLVAPEAVAAMKARVQRQYGRLAVRDGRPLDAVHRFDCALATLQGIAPPAGDPCPLDLPGAPRVAASGGGGGPMVAETEMERAALLARVPGVPRERALAAFAQATDTLTGFGAVSGQVSASMEAYFDLLAAAEASAPSEVNQERFFRAIQAIGEPTVARQIVQLQRVVTANGATGAKLRDRSELERQLVRLRYQIAAAVTPAERKPLEIERADAETRLAAVDAALARDPRLRAISDQPVTVADLRRALRPREAYLKVVQLRRRSFGAAIDADGAHFYALAVPSDTVTAVAARVRASIRDDSGYLPFFDAAAAYSLFKLVAGPAEAALMAADKLVIDPSGPFANLPPGVLVTDLASVKRYADTRKANPNDLSRVAFLAQRAELSAALSPRSFLIGRALPPSREARPFIGFGQNAPAALVSPAIAATRVSLGTGCDLSYAELARMMDANRPVSAAELAVSAAALGDPRAPEVTGAAFTDRAVVEASERGDLERYQVLHFATHGLPETHEGCVRVPPALVTTLAAPVPGQPPSDGLLSFRDIATLRLDANLVVLSACDTASGVSGVAGRLGGQDESGGSLDGLVRAFITANARAVLATFWKVPATQVSADFMRAFYTAGRTSTMGAALRDAQAAAIAVPATSHPYYWGAYFLAGDASKRMLSPQTAVAAR